MDSKGEERPEYIMTQDGFAYLVNGFIGKCGEEEWRINNKKLMNSFRLDTAWVDVT